MAQIKELENMLKHILRVGLEKLKLLRMASIISCWLFSPKILPQSIIQQVLGLWTLNPEFPEKMFLIPVKVSYVLLTNVYYFFKTCIYLLFT